MDPGGGAGWDDSPLDVQIPDDARELARDVLAYHRELRAQRRRSRLRRLASPFAGQGTIMPLLASILAVCLVAGAMLSVATFSPATAPDHHPSAAASSPPAAPQRASPRSPRISATATPSGASRAARPPSSSASPNRTTPSARSNPSSRAREPAPSGSPR